MRALVINLTKETARMAFQRAQLDRLGIGLDRIEAVTPDTLRPAPESAYWQRWQRPLRPAEMAAAASHRAAWEEISRGGVPRLVLEDDAVLVGPVAEMLRSLEGATGLDHVSLETRGRRKLLGAAHPALPLRRLYQDYSGAAAYVLWPHAASLLIARMDRHAGLADAMLCAAYDLSAWQAVPALAVQADQCEGLGLPEPFRVESSILASPRPGTRGLPFGVRAGFRLRRLTGQLRQALRRLSVLGQARRVDIAIWRARS